MSSPNPYEPTQQTEHARRPRYWILILVVLVLIVLPVLLAAGLFVSDEQKGGPPQPIRNVIVIDE